MLLTIRTDKPQAEIGLYKDGQQLGYEAWEAHRALAETIHTKITELLQHHQMQLADLRGIVIYRGPGSFTGLRIGLSVANGLSYGLSIPIVGIEGDDKWLERGIDALLQGTASYEPIMPEYGALVHITVAKK